MDRLTTTVQVRKSFKRTAFHLLELVVLIGIPVSMILAAYCNTLNSPPVLDDYHTFILEDKIQLKDFSVSNLISVAQTKFGWERWIPMLTFALDLNLGKGDLKSFHITNILIHILTFLSVYFLAFQLLEIQKKKEGMTIDILPRHYAVLLAAIWALQPVQTNAITYLVQRMAAIQALFFITSVAFYIRARMLHSEKGYFKQSLTFYLACACSAVGAFFSKENSVMLPFMLILTEAWFFRQDLFTKFWNGIRRSHWGLWIAIVLVGLCSLFLFWPKFERFLFYGYTFRSFNMYERLLTEARIIVWYMSVLVWPLPSRLSFDHDVIISTSILHPPATLLSIILLAILVWQVFHHRKRFPLITYGMLWFFVNLTIESTFIPLELIFEHRLYLPSVGFIISFVTCVLILLRALLPKYSSRDFAVLSKSGLAIVLSLLTLATFIRNEAWENPITIYYDSVQKAPNKPRTHANLAVAFVHAKLYGEAIEEAETAIGLSKGKVEEYAVAAQALVAAHAQKGDFEKAIQRGEELLDQFPKTADGAALPQVCLNLSEAYLQLGLYQKAYDSTLRALDILRILKPQREFHAEKRWIRVGMERVLRASAGRDVDLNGDGIADPGSLPIQTWLANELLARGEQSIAKELAEQASAQYPDEPESYRILETMQKEDNLNRLQRGKWDFTEKYVHRPFSSFNFCMALAFLIRERQMPSLVIGIGEASIDYALKLRPDSADAHLLKGWYHFEKGEAEEALAEARRALELDSDYAKAWLAVGFFATKANQPEEAVAAFEKTLELYPGYSNRAVITGLMAELDKTRSPAPLTGPGYDGKAGQTDVLQFRSSDVSVQLSAFGLG